LVAGPQRPRDYCGVRGEGNAVKLVQHPDKIGNATFVEVLRVAPQKFGAEWLLVTTLRDPAERAFAEWRHFGYKQWGKTNESRRDDFQFFLRASQEAGETNRMTALLGGSVAEAKARLLAFGVVLILETLDEDVRLPDLLAWSRTKFPHQNRRGTKLNAEQIAALSRVESMDYEVYAFAKYVAALQRAHEPVQPLADLTLEPALNVTHGAE
jgi:hypothetical protein